ncbi:MAG: class I SAM-dependent methyltransferase [Hyphomonadaceae bacterium]|nr:class I SAM-dependent methyltransferase [Hyphomonadaceae bacterium]MBX3511766.1 class I SAM-dependent methyltransferase [Hyphomonadaceae bacterium]
MPSADQDPRFWNRTARKYAAAPIADAAGYERTLQETQRRLNPADVVFEFGCGSGTTALRLAPGVARMLATDLSPEMIAIAREKAAAACCANIAFEVGTSAAAGPDGSFDAVLGFNILHLVADRRSTLADVRRALKPGGLFISKTPCLSEMNPAFRVLVPLMRAIGRAPDVAFFTAAQLEQEIAAAGFAIEERARHGSGKRDPRVFLVARKA